ncbi:cell wall hydrolase [Phosphitispora fastidiosa]|uniref:cell wall hydrolase n=1 Tax=Phosphitispora fastidiosa TaxID=2837202 RepID=UPI001E432349|nr:cell wall hydrolase [Phosphitispora fastidiosa]MBU7005580.1 spore germination cell wall hydrolase CwlJ-like protein [Phosphitispora fastidiosa]
MDKVKQMIFYHVTGIFVMLMLAVFSMPGADNAKVTRELAMGQVGWDVRQTQEASGDRISERPAVRTVDTRNVSEPVSRGVSRKEVTMLARAIHGEARGESLQGQAAVGAVIVNRTRSGSFPDSIDGVIFQPGAFDAVDDGQIWLDPDQKSVKAAELALSGYDPTGGAIYYWNPVTSTSRWIWSRAIITQIGEHVFAK